MTQGPSVTDALLYGMSAYRTFNRFDRFPAYGPIPLKDLCFRGPATFPKELCIPQARRDRTRQYFERPVEIADVRYTLERVELPKVEITPKVEARMREYAERWREQFFNSVLYGGKP